MKLYLDVENIKPNLVEGAFLATKDVPLDKCLVLEEKSVQVNPNKFIPFVSCVVVRSTYSNLFLQNLSTKDFCFLDDFDVPDQSTPEDFLLLGCKRALLKVLDYGTLEDIPEDIIIQSMPASLGLFYLNDTLYFVNFIVFSDEILKNPLLRIKKEYLFLPKVGLAPSTSDKLSGNVYEHLILINPLKKED